MRTGRIIAIAMAVAVVSTASAAASGLMGGTMVTPRLAYVKGTTSANIWVGVAGGIGHRLASGDDPLLSPDGRLVAAVRYGRSNTSLALLPTTGGPAKVFYRSGKVTANPIAWSSDSRYLAVELLGDTGKGIAGSGLAVIDTTTMTTKLIASGFLDGASFAPAGASATADELVYGLTRSESPTARVNLYEATPSGAGRHPITSNGRSLNPIWGARGIVFDHERVRGPNAYPAYQLWLLHDGKRRQLTHLRIPQLNSGLVPLDVSASGNRLIAEFSGEDTSYAWRVQLSPLRVSEVKVHGKQVQGAAISRNGRRLLLDQGAFEDPPSRGVVEWAPFGGGRAHRLARGADPSWNE